MLLNKFYYKLDGVKSYQLTKHIDERGFFCELLRQDCNELLGDDKVLQASMSISLPGVIRAWHRHNRGQVDYLIVIEGMVKVAVYGGGELIEILASSEELQVIRIPGHYWHGTKNVGNKPSTTIYFSTKLYDCDNPDEERKSFDDITIPHNWEKEMK